MSSVVPTTAAPRCAVHLSVDMVFLTYPRAKVRNRKRGKAINEASDGEAIVRREGLWRCPIPQCGRCSAPEDIPQPIKMCPRCGELSDAPKYRQAIYDHRCKKCWYRAQQKAARERKTRE
jgi:hypothetical protein